MNDTPYILQKGKNGALTLHLFCTQYKHVHIVCTKCYDILEQMIFQIVTNELSLTYNMNIHDYIYDNKTFKTRHYMTNQQ